MSADRERKLQRYRHLRAINKQQQSAALSSVSETTLLDCARRLGLARGRTITLGSEDEMNLVYDLVVHAGLGGRSSAIARYAAKMQPPPGSDEEKMLAAIRSARFAVLDLERRDETVGLHVRDIASNEMHWLIDEGLEASAALGHIFASRLMAVDDFAMTCGVVVPLNERVLIEASRSMPHVASRSRIELMQDPRFATGLYRAALNVGAMEGVRFVDPVTEDLQAALLAG
jgi:hypothetical protein